MNADVSTTRDACTTSLDGVQRLAEARQAAEAVKRRWARGETPNVDQALVRHPELRHHRSVLLELAHAEYEHRRRAGEPLDAETFSRRFPSLEKSLYLLIEVQELLAHDPELQLFQDALPWPEAGDHYLHFQLVAEIGRGTFGRVFLATEPSLGNRQVVVKIAPSAGGEAEILAKLQHPNIVPIYSLHEDQATGLAAFCMPYLGRATLCDVLDEAFSAGCPPIRAHRIIDAVVNTDCVGSTIDSSRPAKVLCRGSYVDGVIYLAQQLADALVHSHGRGIYHRDLKPSNVLMTSDARPLLLDFNLSIDSRLPAWKVGGTLPYMAPEEVANLADASSDSHIPHYDPRSDLFSLGVIIYQLLAGQLPFRVVQQDCALEDAARQLYRQQAAGPKPLRRFNAGVDRRLARLVESCLAFEPDQRPETALKLAAALRRELAPPRRARRWANNHRTLVTTATVALSLLTLATCLFFSLRPSYSTRERQLGLACIERGQYAAAVDYLSNSIRTSPTSSQALVARGHAFHRQGDFQMAFRDYSLANQLKPNAMLEACKGYCLSRIKSHEAAIAMYERALKEGYERPAIAHNNIGFSCLAMGKLNEAEVSLQRAADLDPSLLAPQYNLLVLALCRVGPGHAISSTAIARATRITKAVSMNADVYRVAAAVYATGARQDRSLIEPAVEYATRAIEAGCSPKVFATDSHFSAVRQEPAFRHALSVPVPDVKPAKVVQIIDPLDGR